MRATYDNDLNFAAFALAIFKPFTPEQAFDALELRKPNKRAKLSDKDYEDILSMRSKGIMWDEIKAVYGLGTGTSIHHRVKRYKERKESIRRETKQC